MLSHVLNPTSCGIDIFEVKLTFEMLTVRATAFIFDTQTGILVKFQRFCDRKCLNLRGTQTPNPRDIYLLVPFLNCVLCFTRTIFGRADFQHLTDILICTSL